MRTIHREIVTGMIFSKEGKLLMVKKNPAGGGVYIDCWHIPGGGIEENETQIDALNREIQEEVGIQIFQYKVELIDDKGSGSSEKTVKETGEKVLVSMQFYVYRIDMVDKSSMEIAITLEKELERYQWFSLEELKTIKLTPPSVTLFTKLGFL